MAQTLRKTRPARKTTGRNSLKSAELSLSAFATELGWFGLVGQDRTVHLLRIGYPSAEEVRASIRQHFAEANADLADEIAERDWFPELRRKLQQFAAGVRVDFSDVDLDIARLGAFQRRVVSAARRIPFGKTATYGQLAARAGSPRAARAVGTVMSSNRTPIIVPCHRVVAAGNKLGGFSAPTGVCLKERMLALEAMGVEHEHEDV